MHRPSYIRIVVFLAVCLVSGRELRADLNPRFTNLNVLNGLSQNSVWCMVRDRQGFMWFGTDDGLNKYDGYQFQVFRRRIGDSTSLASNSLRAMIEDRQGRIWLGTSGGVNVFDPVTETFSLIRIPQKASTANELVMISALAEERRGTILVGTRYNGLYRISPDGRLLNHYTNNPKDSTSIGGGAIRALLIDRAGELWIGTENGGICRYIETSNSFISYKSHRVGYHDDDIASLFEDSKGRLWAGSYFSGILLFDRMNGTRRYFMEPSSNFTGRMDSLTVLTIEENKDGSILFGTFGGGEKVLHPETGAIDTWRNDLSDPCSIGSNSILSMHRDETGCLWIGTYTNGISKYDPDGEHFQTYRNEIPHLTLFTGNNVRTVYRDHHGRIWIGCANGLNIFTPSTGTCEQYQSEPKNRFSLSDNYLSDIFEDSHGLIWIGTRKGLNRFDPKTKRITRVADEMKDSSSFASSYIRAIIEDREGVLWIGTAMGLYSYDRATKHVVAYHGRANDSTSLSSDNIRSLFLDHNGTVWIGTYSGGINRFNHATGTFTSYRHDPNNPNTISNDLASPITEDQNGNLWIGTYGGGLNKLNPRTGKFTVYTENEGLANNIIFGLEVDGKGNIWIATMHGLSSFNPVTNEFRTFTSSAGLQGEEFNLGSSFRDSDGTMFFGGNFGLNVFDPNKLRDNPLIPPVYVTAMSIFNKPVHFDTAMTMKHRIELSYDENSIAFDFVALNYRKPELNQYKYMLEGFDKEWISAGTSRRASYTNLRPGEYVFKVMGSNNDLVWNTTGQAITIVIQPPFWRTWWAYVLYIGGFGAILGAGMEIMRRRERTRLLIEQQEREAEVIRFKNIKLKEANDEILRQQAILKERNEQIEKTNKELQDQIAQRELLVSELKAAMENVKTLGGLIPICSSCKKIRDDAGYWNILESYLVKHSDAQFSHGICPECAEKLYPQFAHKHGARRDEPTL